MVQRMCVFMMLCVGASATGCLAFFEARFTQGANPRPQMMCRGDGCALDISVSAICILNSTREWECLIYPGPPPSTVLDRVEVSCDPVDNFVCSHCSLEYYLDYVPDPSKDTSWTPLEFGAVVGSIVLCYSYSIILARVIEAVVDDLELVLVRLLDTAAVALFFVRRLCRLQ